MLQPGDTLNRGAYRIEQELGAGGFGVVYLAQEVMIPRRVAIKTILPEVAARDRNAAEGFYNEARMTAGLEHHHIIPIYYVGQDHVRGAVVHYIVMEYVEGGDLESAMSREAVDLVQRLRWMRQIAEGLDHAHQQGVIHRDLKLRNVFLTRSRNVKIGDFGLAKALGSETRTIMKGLGTPAYVSPEQIQGKQTDVRADIYSLGIMYYQMATTRLPFDVPETTDPNSKIMAICYQHVNAPVPSARALRPDLPGTLDALIHRMMAKAPEDRPQSVAEVSATLAGVTLGGASDGPPPGVRWAAVAAAAVLVAGVTYGAYWFWSSPSGSASPAEQVATQPAPPIAQSPRPSVPSTGQPQPPVSPPAGQPRPTTPTPPGPQTPQPYPPAAAPTPSPLPRPGGSASTPPRVPTAVPTPQSGPSVPSTVQRPPVATAPSPPPPTPQPTPRPGSSSVAVLTPQPPSTSPTTAPRPPTPQPPAARPDPGAMKTELEHQLRRASLDLRVDVTSSGIVTLIGVVDDQNQKERAVSLAKGVAGVADVRAQINVRKQWGE